MQRWSTAPRKRRRDHSSAVILCPVSSRGAVSGGVSASWRVCWPGGSLCGRDSTNAAWHSSQCYYIIHCQDYNHITKPACAPDDFLILGFSQRRVAPDRATAGPAGRGDSLRRLPPALSARHQKAAGGSGQPFSRQNPTPCARSFSPTAKSCTIAHDVTAKTRRTTRGASRRSNQHVQI